MSASWPRAVVFALSYRTLAGLGPGGAVAATPAIRCRYATDWLTIETKWTLTVTQPD
jgi:hypothetical protein